MLSLEEDEICPTGASSSPGITNVPGSEADFTTSAFIRRVHAPGALLCCCQGRSTSPSTCRTFSLHRPIHLKLNVSKISHLSSPSEREVWGWQLCSLAKVLPAGRPSPMGALMGKEEELGKGAGRCETQITAPVSELLQQSPFSWWVPSPSAVLAKLSWDRRRAPWTRCCSALWSSPT